jgi:hypothetical protein
MAKGLFVALWRKPSTRGAFGTQERASARAATGAEVGGSMEAGRMITRLMTSQCTSKNAGQKGSLSADPSDFSFAASDH